MIIMLASLYTNKSVDRLLKKVHNINPYYGYITEKTITNNYFSYNNIIYHQKEELDKLIFRAFMDLIRKG